MLESSSRPTNLCKENIDQHVPATSSNHIRDAFLAVVGCGLLLLPLLSFKGELRLGVVTRLGLNFFSLAGDREVTEDREGVEGGILLLLVGVDDVGVAKHIFLLPEKPVTRPRMIGINQN